MNAEPTQGATFAAELSKDRTHVILTVTIGSGTVERISLLAPDLEEIIQKLAVLRSNMADPVPSTIDPGSRLQAISNPPWQLGLSSSPSSHGVILSFRHPGIGWITNQLSINQACELGNSLLNLIYTPFTR